MSLSAQKETENVTAEGGEAKQKEDADLTNKEKETSENTQNEKNEEEKNTQQIEDKTQENTNTDNDNKETDQNTGLDVDKEKEEENAENEENERDDSEDDCEEEEKKAQEPINIDLSRMKSLYQFRSRPTLPYLLTEYGMEDKNAPLMKQKSKDKEKKKKKKSFGDDSGRDREKEKQHEERHLQIFNDMAKLRDYYYEEYSSLLHNKVQEQRQKIRERDQAMKTKLEEEEKAKRGGWKRRLERHEFISDDSFLQDLPKTDVYHIVQLQDRLIKEGVLKSQSDLANFWERIQQPDIFYMYFKVPKSDDLKRQESDFNDNASSKAPSTLQSSQSNVGPPSTVQKREGPRALSRIAESREPSRPGTRQGQHWAITQQFPSQHRAERRRSSFTGLMRPAPVQAKSSYLQELEKRFPKLEMPKLHCFTMSLGPKPPHPDEVRHTCRLRELEKNRKKYSYKLNKMHQLAMANAAAASRILEMHEDIDFIINGSPLTDLISDHHFYSGLPPSDHRLRAAMLEGQPPPPSTSSPVPVDLDGTVSGHHILPCLLEQDESNLPSPVYSRRSSTSQKSKQSKKPSPKLGVESRAERTPIIPLSLNEVEDKTNIVSAKCMSTLWTNYMKDVPAGSN